jgi:hypothetical protein
MANRLVLRQNELIKSLLLPLQLSKVPGKTALSALFDNPAPGREKVRCHGNKPGRERVKKC